MKMIRMHHLQTKECETMPADKFEVQELKRKCFDEGWWKGFASAFISCTAGFIIGSIIVGKFMSDIEKA